MLYLFKCFNFSVQLLQIWHLMHFFFKLVLSFASLCKMLIYSLDSFIKITTFSQDICLWRAGALCLAQWTCLKGLQNRTVVSVQCTLFTATKLSCTYIWNIGEVFMFLHIKLLTQNWQTKTCFPPTASSFGTTGNQALLSWCCWIVADM